MHRLPRCAPCMSYCTAALDTIACATALQRASSRQFGSGQGAVRCWRRCWSRALSRSCIRESGIIIPRRDRQRRTQGFTTTEFIATKLVVPHAAVVLHGSCEPALGRFWQDLMVFSTQGLSKSAQPIAGLLNSCVAEASRPPLLLYRLRTRGVQTPCQMAR